MDNNVVNSGSAVNFDRLTHAYILSGSGARSLAGRIAAAVVCSASSGRPCGQCRHCRKAFAGIHPDITTTSTQDGRAGILVGQARTLRADAYIIPNEAERKVYIIDPADKMNPQAQNALLKILEEPPAFVSFLLIAENPNLLLDTVRSRCVEISDASGDQHEAPDAAAEEFMALLEGGSKLALADAIIALDKKDKSAREQMAKLSKGVQALALERLKKGISNSGRAAFYMDVISVFRRFDEYMAANVSAGNLAGLLLSRFVPLGGSNSK